MPERVIVHIDMDAFFAAVEQRDNPALRGQPVVIGADPKLGKGRGVVSTCSYEARKFGIHSAQPISKAYQLCPQAHFLRGSSKKYSAVSRQIKEIFYDFTPDVEPISIDEAFLDITGCYHLYKTPKNLCLELKKRIEEEIGLTASVGIAPVKMVAKIASDFDKPDGLVVVGPSKIQSFLNPLQVGRLWGVGKKMQETLSSMGIKLVSDLAQIPKEKLVERLGSHGEHLYNLSHGIDPREVKANEEVKSVSHEHTFEEDTSDVNKVHNAILIISEKVSRRLRKKDLKGKTISVKIRLKGFQTFTRAKSIGKQTNLTDDIYSIAKEIFDQFHQQGQYIRLIGVRVSNFERLYVSDDLFESATEKRSESVDVAMDQIKDKFGEKAIHRGLKS